MKKFMSMALFMGVFAVVGNRLRVWQLASAFEEETGLLIRGAGATYALVGWLVLGAVALFFLARWAARGYDRRGYLHAFGVEKPALPVGCLWASAALFGAAGVLGLRDRMAGMEPGTVRLILSLGLILTAAAAVLIGRLALSREEGKGRFAWPLVVPSYCGCVWLVCAYQEHTANPTVMEYCFFLLAVVAAILASYAVASFSFRRPRPILFLWMAGMAFILLGVSLPDARRSAWSVLSQGGSRTWGGQELLIVLGYMVYLATQALIFCQRLERPLALVEWQEPPGEGAEPPEGEDRAETKAAGEETGAEINAEPGAAGTEEKSHE